MRNANELLLRSDARCCNKEMNEKQEKRKKKSEERKGRWR
jgi:hypothetical protein